jgi:hypothetical protein
MSRSATKKKSVRYTEQPKQARRTPPVPQLAQFNLSAKEGHYPIDGSVRKLMAAGRFHPKLLSTRNPFSWTRRSVVVAGIVAVNRSERHGQHRRLIKRERRKVLAFINSLDEFRRDGLHLIEQIEKKTETLKLDDPTLASLVIKQKGKRDLLQAAIDHLECAAPYLNDLLEDHYQIETSGNTDVLADHFIRAIRDIWLWMTGTFPASAASGPFVNFADQAWAMLGWDHFFIRTSLGKRIALRAKRENWSRLRRMKPRAERG